MAHPVSLVRSPRSRRHRAWLLAWLVTVAVVSPSTGVAAATDAAVNKLEAFDSGHSHEFGIGVAAAGDLVVVAAPGAAETGAVYVYEGDGLTAPREVKLIPSDGSPGDRFGGPARIDSRSDAVATDGTRIAIGAPGAGAAYIFEPDGAGGWTETKLTSAAAGAEDEFGGAVAIDGSRVVVGAKYADAPEVNSGSVFVFDEATPGVWTETELHWEDNPGGVSIGTVVDLAGSVVVAGTPFGHGGVIFEETSPGTWIQTTPSLPNKGRLGFDVAADADRVAISDTEARSVHVGIRTGPGAWDFTEIHTPTGTRDTFGAAVDLVGTSVYVGAPDTAAADGSIVGAAYSYQPDGGGGFTGSQLIAYDGVHADYFGKALAASRTRLVVGASSHNGSTHYRAHDSGAAYVYQESAADWTPPTAYQPFLTVVSAAPAPVEFAVTAIDNLPAAPSIVCDPASGATFTPGPTDVTCVVSDSSGNIRTFDFKVTVVLRETTIPVQGWELALDRDVMVIGRSENDKWTVSAFELDAGDWQEAHLITLDKDPWSDESGYEVAVAGHTIVVGDHESAPGVAYVFEPDGADGWNRSELHPDGNGTRDDFGHSVSISDDTIVVGDPANGAVYVFERGDAGWTQARKIERSSPSPGFGHSVSVDDDRIVVGYPRYQSNRGAVFVYDGDDKIKLQAADGVAGDSFGGTVAVSRNRIVVGTRHDDEESSNTAEKAYVYEQQGGTWHEARLVPSDGTGHGWFGWTVAIARDLIAVSAPQANATYFYTPDPSGNWVEGKLIRKSNSFRLGNSVAVSLGRIAVHGSFDRTYIYEIARQSTCDGEAGTIFGTSGDDRLIGTDGADVVIAGAGHDLIRGKGGNDIICAGGGRDVIYAGNGHDTIFGGNGADKVMGGGRDDEIDGGPGDDRIWGERGDDRIRGNSGNDRLFGNQSDDILRGGGGEDFVRGGAGDDILWGGPDDDYLHGGTGDDYVVPGPGTDTCVSTESSRGTCEIVGSAGLPDSVAPSRREPATRPITT